MARIELTLVLCAFLIADVKSDQNETDTDVITRRPGTTTESPEKILLEFEARRSLSFSTLEGRIRKENALSLCNTIETDVDMLVGLKNNRAIHFVPVKSAPGFRLPNFVDGCFGWIRKPCVGIPKSPFDYRCHFWTPFFLSPEDVRCEYIQETNPSNIKRTRPKRAARFDNLVLNGLETVTLCGSLRALYKRGRRVTVGTLAIPTNEASTLRCINWKLASDGSWSKDKLPDAACELQNFKRPSNYVLNEVSGKFIVDIFEHVILCLAKNIIVDCQFLKNNVQETEK